MAFVLQHTFTCGYKQDYEKCYIAKMNLQLYHQLHHYNVLDYDQKSINKLLIIFKIIKDNFPKRKINQFVFVMVRCFL